MSRSLFGLALLACLAVAAPAHASVTGSGHRTTEARKVADFTRVRLVFPVDATFTEGDHTACSLTVDDNLQALVKTEVDGGTLTVIGPHHGVNLHRGAGLTCTVKRLEALTIDSAAQVTIHGGKAVHDLKLRVNGAGSVHYTGTAGRLKVELDGAADIVLAGKAARLTVALNGTGGVDAEGLTATDAEVTVDGAGAAHLTLGGGRARLRVNGVGSIDWAGTVSALDAHAGMLGSIDRRG